MDESINGVMDSFVDAASYGNGGLSPVTLKAVSVVLDGPDFDRASGVQMIAYQGPSSTISIEGSVIAAPMGRLINEARADAELTVGAGYGSISLSGNALSLGLASEGEVQKTVDNSLSFYTHSKNAGQTGDISVVAANDLTLGGISIVQEGLLLAGKGFVEWGPVGRGGDILFQGKNVIGQAVPNPVLWFDGHYTGNLTFAAEDQLTLGLGRYIYVNSDPSETHSLTFKGKNIRIGYEEQFNDKRWGTNYLLVHDDIADYTAPQLVMRADETITLLSGFQTNDDFNTVGPNKGLPGGHGVSAVDIQAKDIVFNASKLSLHSNFEHRIVATDTLKFTNHSQIEIKDSDVTLVFRLCKASPFRPARWKWTAQPICAARVTRGSPLPTGVSRPITCKLTALAFIPRVWPAAKRVTSTWSPASWSWPTGPRCRASCATPVSPVRSLPRRTPSTWPMARSSGAACRCRAPATILTSISRALTATPVTSRSRRPPSCSTAEAR